MRARSSFNPTPRTVSFHVIFAAARLVNNLSRRVTRGITLRVNSATLTRPEEGLESRLARREESAVRAYTTIAEGNRVTSSDICFAVSAGGKRRAYNVCATCRNYDWKAHLEDRARRERHGWGVDLTTLPFVPYSRKATAHVCIMHRAPSCLCIVPRRDRARARALLSRLTDRRAGSWKDAPQRPGETFSDGRLFQTHAPGNTVSRVCKGSRCSNVIIVW